MDDPKLKIEEGLQGDFVLIGFPHHIGAKRDQVRGGQDHGPDCLRRFIPRIGPLLNAEYMKDISKFILSDYGNIHVEQDECLEALLDKLRSKVQIVKNKQHVPIIIGGTKECAIAAYDCQLTVISIIPSPDMQPLYDGDKASINSGMRAALNKNNELNVVYFAHQISKVDNNTLTQDNRIQQVSLQEIRRTQVVLTKDLNQPITQGGIAFKHLLGSIKADKLHLSISLEAIDSANCPGVSRPATIGLNAEEAIEIMWQAGLDNRIVSIDITDYNPTIEDYRTGFLLGNLIYYYILSRGNELI